MKQRVITAIVFFGILIPVIYVGGLPLTIAVTALSVIGLFEMLRMKRLTLFSGVGLIALIPLLAMMWFSSASDGFLANTDFTMQQVLYIALFLLLIATVVTKNKYTFDDVGYIIASILYVGIGFHYFIETRALGVEYIFYALLIVWTTDSGAYFIGKAIGKNKLWPEISPNKTIEGFVGGLVSAVVILSVYHYFFPVADHWLTFIIVTLFASAFGQLGDLVESAIKRHYHVKDSGKLLPGHGGVMDRFDSLLFVLPFLHIVQLFV